MGHILDTMGVGGSYRFVRIPTMGDSSISGAQCRPQTKSYQNLVWLSRTNAPAQPATIISEEFAIKARFSVSPLNIIIVATIRIASALVER
jgi:hypothetical protein